MEQWEKRLEIILTAWKTIKAEYRNPTLMIHDFPVWKLGKEWEIERQMGNFRSYYTASPKDRRLEGLTLFS